MDQEQRVGGPGAGSKDCGERLSRPVPGPQFAVDLLDALGIKDKRGITRVVLDVSYPLPKVTIDRIVTRDAAQGLCALLQRTKFDLVLQEGGNSSITGREAGCEEPTRPSQDGHLPVR